MGGIVIMKNIFLLLMIFSVSLGILFEVPTFCQEISGEICGLPEESLISKGTTAYSWPYYPKDATLKALVIFVKFRDDNVDIPPHTDLWPHDLAGLPSWTPNIISSSVLPSYSNPSISGYFDEMSMGQFQLIGDVYPQLYVPPNDQSYYYTSNGRHIGYLVEEILTAIDPNVNFANYDNLSPNGYSADGVVDMIFICFRFFDTVNLGIYSKKCSGICGLTGNKQEFSGGKKYITLDGKKNIC